MNEVTVALISAISGSITGALGGGLVSYLLRIGEERRAAAIHLRRVARRICRLIPRRSKSRVPDPRFALNELAWELEDAIDDLRQCRLRPKQRRRLGEAETKYRNFYQKLTSPTGTGLTREQNLTMTNALLLEFETFDDRAPSR